MISLQRRLVLSLLGAAFTLPAVAAHAAGHATTVETPAMSQKDLYDALLDALYATFGHHHGFRVAHAKGILAKGTFVASSGASLISRAPYLKGAAVPVLLRFSNFSGLPGTRDGDPTASPHGLAIRLSSPDGPPTDIVTHSFNGFPVANASDFLSFLQGIAANVAVPPDPLPLEHFLAGHPQARRFLDAPKPASRSYLGIEYFGVNALQFINAQGERRVGRYRIEPPARLPPLSDDEVSASSTDYLQEALTARLAQGPVTLRLVLQLAEPGDIVDDPSIAWPRSNPEIELGHLRVEALVPPELQSREQQRMDFNPGRLPDGIEASADPMIKAREGIYARALERRRLH